MRGGEGGEGRRWEGYRGGGGGRQKAGARRGEALEGCFVFTQCGVHTCRFTPQYAELEDLYEKLHDQV